MSSRIVTGKSEYSKMGRKITASEVRQNKDKEALVEKASRTKDDASTRDVPATGDKYNLLGEAIHFYDKPSMKKHAKVPPPTPAYNIDYQRPIEHKPVAVSHVQPDELPHVSDSGIRFSIQALGKILGYDEYEYDLVQFWLLDILTDCLWKAQDVFKFEENEQKVILEWVTGIFKIIADPILNLSRKQFLRLFKNVLFALYRDISESCEKFPETSFMDSHVREIIEQEEMLFTRLSNEDDDSSSSSEDSNVKASVSTFSITSADARKIMIQPEFDIKEHINHLKKNNPVGNIVHAYSDKCLLSDSNIYHVEEEEERHNMDYTTSLMTDPSAALNTTYPFWAKYKKFRPLDNCICIDSYVIDLQDREYEDDIYSLSQLQSTSDRSVVSSTETLKDMKSTLTVNPPTNENIKSVSGQVIDYLQHPDSYAVRPQSAIATSLSSAQRNLGINHPKSELSRVQVSAEIADIDQHALDLGAAHLRELELDQQRQMEAERQRELELERQNEIEIMKEWTYFKLIEQRNWDMNDPAVGWIPWLSWMEKQSDTGTKTLEENIAVAADSFAQVKSADPLESTSTVHSCSDLRKLNFNILKAIVDFVFEYFYENFHFTLIKLAFRCPPNLITQTVNQEWNIPKVMKTPFKRPKEAKPKKEKRSKSKSSKSSKSKKSKESKSNKKGKDSKKGKDKKSKKDKKEKKEKKEKKGKPKLTPEELAELERQKMEAEQLEAKLQEQEENRVFLFPLADAASENLFMSIFENWVKAKQVDKDEVKESKKEKKKKKKKK